MKAPKSGSDAGPVRVSAVARPEAERTFLARGVAVYPELDRRMVNVPLTDEQAALLRGRVRLEYREPAERGGDVIAAVDADLG